MRFVNIEYMDEIYREELLEIVRHPVNKGSIADPSVSVQKQNPMCGDEVTVQLTVTDGVIQDIKFDGQACAVTVIASSLLSEHVMGMKIQDAQALTKDDLLNLMEINLTTSRVKCATLFLDALHEALRELDSRLEIKE